MLFETVMLIVGMLTLLGFFVLLLNILERGLNSRHACTLSILRAWAEEISQHAAGIIGDCEEVCSQLGLIGQWAEQIREMCITEEAMLKGRKKDEKR